MAGADRSVLVRLRANVSQYVAAMGTAQAATKSLYNDINTTNDRTAWLAQGVLALTPAFTRLGAGAVPVLSGIATQATVAAAAAGTMALAFNGIGDALGALNDYQMAPTQANLDKLNETMSAVGEEGAEFVRFLDTLGPQFTALANVSREGMFPGITEGIEDFMTLMPQVSRIVSEVAEGIGTLGADAGAGLSGEGFAPFFEYLENNARPILEDMGRTIGNFAEGFANMLVQFGPLTDDFSSGLLEMSRSFADWSENLASSQGFQEFLDYVREAGPDALDFLGSLVMALVEIVEAAAPIGAVMLPVLTQLLDILGALANTPLGPLVIGFAAITSAIGRLRAVAELTGTGALGKITTGVRENASAAKAAVPSLDQFSTALYRAGQAQDNQSAKTKTAMGAVRDFGRTVAPMAGQAALLGVAVSGVGDKMGVTNAVSLALAGSLAGPWGAAAGGAIGLMLDMKAAGDQSAAAIAAMGAAAKAGDLEALSTQLAEMKARVDDFNDVSGVGDFLADEIGGLLAGPGVTDRMDREAEAVKKFEAELRRLQETQSRSTNSREHAEAVRAVGEAAEYSAAKLRALREETIRGMNAELNYKGAILDAKDAVQEHGRVLRRNGELINENSRAGIEAKGTLLAMASAFNAQSDATRGANGAGRTAINTFVNMAEKMGMGAREARELAREILDIPAKRNVDVTVNTGTARGAIADIQGRLDAMRDKQLYVRVTQLGAVSSRSRMPGPQPALEQAEGGMLSDVPNRHQPVIARANGRVRIWAEPETQGETYIPHANDHRRPRAKNLLEQTASMFGGQVSWYADGGSNGDGDRDKGKGGDRDRDKLTRKEQVKLLNQQLKAAQKAMEAAEAQHTAAEMIADAAQQQYDAIKAQRESLEASVRGNLTPNLIQQGTTLGDFDRGLTKWQGNADASQQTIQALIAAGLDGPLLEEATKNGDLRFLTQLLASGPAGIAAYEQRYAQAQGTTAAAAALVGNAQYGAQEAAAWENAQRTADHAEGIQREVERLNQHGERLEHKIDRVEKAIEKSADRMGDKMNGTTATAKDRAKTGSTRRGGRG